MGEERKSTASKEERKVLPEDEYYSWFGKYKSIAPFVFNGTCNTELFNNWVEQFLIKELTAGQVVVLDNATFHKSKKTKELIESVGCRVIFLLPYSPDLNPIEKFWANMKKWIKQKIGLSQELYNNTSIY